MALTSWIPLLCLPPVVVLLAWLIVRKDWFVGRKRRTGLIYAAAAAAILLALAQPTVSLDRSEPPAAIFLADASPSMRFAQPWPSLAQETRRALTPGTELGVVAFSGSSQIILAPGRQSDTPSAVTVAGLGEGTNLEQALRAAMSLSPGSNSTALILYSDGYETDGSAVAAALEARQRGLRLYVLPPQKSEPRDAALVDLKFPERLTPGQPVIIRVAVRANRGGPARLTIGLSREADAGRAGPELSQSADVDLVANQPRWQQFSFQPTSAGRYAGLVTVAMAGDTVPENDRWPFAIQIGDRRPLLLVTFAGENSMSDPPPSADLAAKLAGAEFTLVTVDVSAMPTAASALADYAAVVLDDVPAYAVAPSAMAALVQFVRDLGGGLVALGGRHSFGLGGYGQTALDDLLPVKSDPEDRPPVQLVMVIDRSGSMSEPAGESDKLSLAKAAAIQISALLNAEDRVSLVAFNQSPQTIARGISLKEWETLRASLAPLRPTGGTQLGRALDEALAILAATPATAPAALGGTVEKKIRRHLIVVTDGLVVGPDRQVPFNIEALLARARELSATISLVLTSKSAAWPELERLARSSGGQAYDLSGGLVSETGRNRLAQIFLEDLPIPILQAEPTRLAMRDRAPLWPAESPLLKFADLPQHLVTEPKSRAAMHLVTVPPPSALTPASSPSATAAAAADRKPHPVLASWPYGLGRAVAWPLPWAGPSAAWMATAEVRQAYVRSLEWAARGPVAEADYDVTISAAGGRLAVGVVERKLAAGLAPMAELWLTVAGRGDQPATRLRVPAVGPGEWRLAQSLPAGVYGYALTVGRGGAAVPGTGRDGNGDAGDGRGSAAGSGERRVREGTLSTGPSAEFLNLGVNQPFLRQLAELGGGTVLKTAGAAGEIRIELPKRQQLWPYLLALAGLLLIVDTVGGLLNRQR